MASSFSLSHSCWDSPPSNSWSPDSSLSLLIILHVPVPRRCLGQSSRPVKAAEAALGSHRERGMGGAPGQPLPAFPFVTAVRCERFQVRTRCSVMQTGTAWSAPSAQWEALEGPIAPHPFPEPELFPEPRPGTSGIGHRFQSLQSPKTYTPHTHTAHTYTHHAESPRPVKEALPVTPTPAATSRPPSLAGRELT